MYRVWCCWKFPALISVELLFGASVSVALTFRLVGISSVVAPQNLPSHIQDN